jgi:hypothetical protein
MRRRTTAALSSVALSAALVVTSAKSARAEPQWNAALVPAGCLLGEHASLFDRVAFCGAVRGDVLFLRNRARDFGLGPYVALGTAAFEDVRVSLGLSALIPIAEDFPVVLSLGPLLRNGRRPGLSSLVFAGVRSYNFHASYNLAFGIAVGYDRDLADPRENALSIGVQVDAFVLALPVLLLVGAVR